jgi:glycoside/pentoside/hexuronide:cation symporter, GPH family
MRQVMRKRAMFGPVMTEAVAATTPQPNSMGRLILFAAPLLPLAMLTLPLGAYIPPLYAKAGIPLALIGLIFMAARIFDVVTDPIMGALTDKTRTRFGRRRPWLLIGAPIFAVSVAALFFPPDGVGALWLIFWLFMVMIGATILGVTHGAWSADIATSYNERSRVQAVLIMTSILASLCVMIGPALAERVVDDPVTARASLAGGLIVILTFPMIALAVFGVRESAISPVETSPTPPHVAVWEALKRQVFLRRLLFADFMQGVAGGVIVSMIAFYAEAKGVPRVAAQLLLAFFVSGLICVPVWIWLSFRLGKARTIGISSLVSIGLLLLVAFAPAGNPVLVLAAFAAFGSTMGVWIFLMKSILSDLIEIEETATGQPRAGIMFALFLLTQKLGGAFAVGISYLILGLGGFKPGIAPDPSMALTIIVLTVIAPIIGHGVMAFVTLTWKGDKQK